MADTLPPTIEETTPLVPTFPDEPVPTVSPVAPPVIITPSTPSTPPKKKSSTKTFWAGLGIIVVVLGIVYVLGRTVPSVKLTVGVPPTPIAPTIVTPIAPTPTATPSATPTATPSAAVRYSLPTPTIRAK